MFTRSAVDLGVVGRSSTTVALEVSIDDHYMGGIVDQYHGQHTGPAYWAVWVNVAD